MWGVLLCHLEGGRECEDVDGVLLSVELYLINIPIHSFMMLAADWKRIQTVFYPLSAPCGQASLLAGQQISKLLSISCDM